MRRAVSCFLAQDYPNTELIVVHPKDDSATAECLASFRDDRIKPFPLERPNATLGQLRNFSIEQASGEYLCSWDDDDWYSPERITRQYEALSRSGKSATVLTSLILYDAVRQTAHLSQQRLWENSVFFEKREIVGRSIAYPPLNQDEDYYFVTRLVTDNLVYPLNDPTLYVYHGTGANTVGTAHYDVLVANSSPLDAYQTAVVRKCIDLELSPKAALEEMRGKRFRGSISYVAPCDVDERRRELEILTAWRKKSAQRALSAATGPAADTTDGAHRRSVESSNA